MLTTLFFALLFALNDRWTGGGFGWKRLAHDHGGPLHGRPVYYAALPTLALCYALGGWPAAALALAWGVYRASFGFPDGTLTGRHLEMTWYRHVIGGLLAAFVVVCFGLPAGALLPFAVYVVAAVVLAKWNGDAIKRHGDINGYVETIRGAAWGLAMGAALNWPN